MGIRIFSFLFLALWAAPLWAEELANHPGWTLTLIRAESDDGSYDERQFFTLRPPDGRPAVTVDYGTASRLKKGGMEAEAAYTAAGGGAERTAEAASRNSSQDGEYVYDSSNRGFVQADPLLSTAPSDERPELAAEHPVHPVHPEHPIHPVYPEGTAFGSTMAGHSSGAFSAAPFNSPAPHPAPPSRAPAAATTIPDLPAPPPPAPLAGDVPPPPAPHSIPPPPVSAAPPVGVAAGAGKDYELYLGGDPAQRKPAAAPAPGVSGLVANNRAQGFGIKPPENSGTGTQGSQRSGTTKEIEEIVPPCTPGRKVYTSATLERINLPRGCHVVMITAWGAGGGAGYSPPSTEEYGWYQQQNGPGGAGAFVSASGDVDARKYDLVVVVGAAGESARQGKAGKGGFPGGGDGGSSSMAPGGGGGGFTGVFLVEKEMGGKLMRHANALMIAAGGGGGAGRGPGGGGAGIDVAEGARGAKTASAGNAKGNASSGAALNGGNGGVGLAYPHCSRITRNGVNYCVVYEGEGGYTEIPEDQGSAGGGGGGGGYYGGAGGAGAVSGANSEPGGGGSSYGSIQMLLTSAAKGTTPGFNLHPERGGAGSPGRPGRLEIEWY